MREAYVKDFHVASPYSPRRAAGRSPALSFPLSSPPMLRLAAAALALLAAPLAAQPASELIEAGDAAYRAGDYAESGRLLAAGLDAGSRNAYIAFYAACAFALSDQPDAAFRYLDVAADLGFTSLEQLTTDSDLASLRDDARWAGTVASYERRAADAARLWSSPTLVTPFEEDLSLDEKILGLSTLWSEAKFNFVNFDLVPRLDWDSLYVATLPRVRATESTLEYYQVLRETVSHLRDGHSGVDPPRQLTDRIFARPGLRTRLVEGRVWVMEIRDPSLADSGLDVGQEVLQIDGVPVHDYADTRVRPYQAASTEQDLDAKTYGHMLLVGDATTPVELTLRDASGRTRTVTVPRLSREQEQGLAWALPAFAFELLPGNVAHVRLNTFSRPEAADQFEAHFDQIAQADALVLDVRDNGGGDGAVGFRVLCALTADDQIPTPSWRTRLYRPLSRAREQGEAIDGDPTGGWSCGDERHFDGPVALLTSARTYSAAEDFTVAFDLMDRGLIVGEPTGGSTGQPLSVRLPGGGWGRLTTRRDAYPDGTDYVGSGVSPDLVVGLTVNDVRAGRDSVLEAALDAVRGR